MANPHYHLDETMAASLVANKLPGLERSRAVRHLLAGCEECRQKIRSVFAMSRWMPADILEPFAEIGTVLSAAMLDLDLINGELLWRDIERRRPKERHAFLRSSPGHRTYGAFRAGLAACRKLSQKRPAEAVEVAQLLSMLAELVALPLPSTTRRGSSASRRTGTTSARSFSTKPSSSVTWTRSEPSCWQRRA